MGFEGTAFTVDDPQHHCCLDNFAKFIESMVEERISPLQQSVQKPELPDRSARTSATSARSRTAISSRHHTSETNNSLKWAAFEQGEKHLFLRHGGQQDVLRHHTAMASKNGKAVRGHREHEQAQHALRLNVWCLKF